jgi:metal-responsive CopG/Arc/MetJ family transcriptional regulator
MPKTRVVLSLSAALLERIDALVREGRLHDRSQAIEAALEEKLLRLNRTRLAEECARLDRSEELALAEEGLGTAVRT